MVTVEHISVEFSSRPILDDISFLINKKDRIALVGKNGAGKTTTIRLLLDILKADEGEIFLFGENIKSGSAKLREDIGVVFDEMGFHEFMTGRQINTMMKHIFKNWDEEIFASYMKRFSLPMNKKCGDYLLDALKHEKSCSPSKSAKASFIKSISSSSLKSKRFLSNALL